MPTTIKTRPGWSQELGSQARFPMWVAGTHAISHHWLPPRMHVGRKLDWKKISMTEQGTLGENVLITSSNLTAVSGAGPACVKPRWSSWILAWPVPGLPLWPFGEWTGEWKIFPSPLLKLSLTFKYNKSFLKVENTEIMKNYGETKMY